MRFSTAGFFLAAMLAAAQAPVTPPPLPADLQQRIATLPEVAQVYERFRYWAGFQPPEVQQQALRHYDAYLTALGVPADEPAKQLKTIESEGRRLEVDRWNRILTSEKPAFNTRPNAFLVEMVKGRQPGAALDVGMGQGRNAIYLAQAGMDGDRVRSCRQGSRPGQRHGREAWRQADDRDSGLRRISTSARTAGTWSSSATSPSATSPIASSLR